ncbi:MAG TPA: cytochrome c3 family protein [Aggregatilineaceae bacterium]|nr:cytochrome c3 family protein [Aggregatilineaceae bacterium]
MGQVFPRSANIIAPVSIVVVLLLIGAAVGFVILYPQTYVPAVRDQPIPFSHQQHVGDMGIDCRYCHTTVETSAFAGMPSTQICMNCHSEVKSDSDKLALLRDSDSQGKALVWNRVYSLPDYTYFDHSAHVTKGVACVTCHGQIDQMPITVQVASLQMSWCMDCHRDPTPNIRPRDQVTSMNWQAPANSDPIRQQLIADYHVESKTSCSTCHR